METTSTPKNFFLQAGIIVSLYASIVSFLTFLFNLIDKTFPAMDGGYSYFGYDAYGSGMRFAISTLIVMFPLFVYLSRLYRKIAASDSSIRESKIRKWLIYLTLFLAGLTIAIDLITLINSFLQGTDITAAFLLKVLVVLIVALKVFYFYLQDIKGYWETNPGKAKYVAWAVSTIVVIAVIGGFFAIGSPASQQKLSRDQSRISDLQNIQWQIVQYYQFKNTIPDTLADLIDPISGYVAPVDPVTKIVYAYTKKSDLAFTLCTVFETESNVDGVPPVRGMSYAYPENVMNENWRHEAGETCFERTIDPELYPQVPKQVR